LTIAGLGGILGVRFSLPLRRSMIIEQGLAFPEGKAAAEVLRTGDNPAQGVKVLAAAGLLGGLGKFAAASGLSVLATRKPISKSRMMGKLLLRTADRRPSGTLYHEPPRRTRKGVSPLCHAEPFCGAPR